MKSNLYNNSRYAKYLEKMNSLTWRGRLILKTVLKYLAPQPEDRILEIGCNRGEMVKEVKKYSKNVIGIDISTEAVGHAVTSDIINMDGTDISFPSNYFDKIYSSHTIEHVPDLNKFIKESDRILKPGGKLLLLYPIEIFRGSGTLLAALVIYRSFLMARRLHLHKITPGKIKKLIAITSLRHLKSGIRFIPYPSYFSLLEKKK